MQRSGSSSSSETIQVVSAIDAQKVSSTQLSDNPIKTNERSKSRWFFVDSKWLTLIGAVFSRIICTGTVVYLGVFFDYIRYSFADNSYSQLSIVVSTANGLLEGMGVVNSLLIERFEPRYMVLFGALFAFVGVIWSCFTRSYYALLIGLGIFNGLGQSTARYIMPTVVGYMFDDSLRHIALSIMNTGDGVGGLLFPPFSQWLIDQLSWRNAMLILAACILNLCVCAFTVPLGISTCIKAGSKIKKEKQTEICEKEVCLMPNLILFYLNILWHSVGYGIFMAFIYTEMKSKNCDASTATRIASLIGGVSIIGRLSVSFMPSNRPVPRWLIYSLGHIVRGLIVIGMVMIKPSNDSQAVWMFTVICSLFGLSDGVTGSLIAVVCVDLFGLRRFKYIFGWEMLVMGLGALLGLPIAGALRDTSDNLNASFYLSGLAFIFAGLILLPLFFTSKQYELEKGYESNDHDHDHHCETTKKLDQRPSRQCCWWQRCRRLSTAKSLNINNVDNHDKKTTDGRNRSSSSSSSNDHSSYNNNNNDVRLIKISHKNID